MATISTDLVKELRAMTGAGIIDTKKALEESNGNMEEAITILQKKGAKIAAKKAGRKASEGVIEAYIHCGGRIGVLLELNCETDFVAKNEKFKELAHDIAMHIAAMNPEAVRTEDIPNAQIEKQKEIFLAQLKEEKKPEAIMGKIIEGKIKKYKEERALLTQPFVKNQDITIAQRIEEAIGAIGENIQVKRFARFDIKGMMSLCDLEWRQPETK